MTETLALPIDSDPPHMAALLYLAVLAFPDRTDWRDDFMFAVKTWYELPPPIGARRLAAINRVAKRLDSRRAAARIAAPILTASSLARMRIPLRVHGRAVTARIDFKLQVPHERPFRPTVYTMARNLRAADRAPNNILAREWKPSLPVLHMALAFDRYAPKHVKLLELIEKPEWVRAAAAACPAYDAALVEHMPQIGPRVRILAQ